MKKNLILLMFLFCFFLGYCQKQYFFDYKIVYNLQVKDSSQSTEVFYYTNSKDNSYRLRVAEKDSLHFHVRFLDQNGTVSEIIFTKEEFLNAKQIVLDCEIVHSYNNPYKYQTKNYDFSFKKEKEESFYILKSNKPKREKKKKLGTFYYYVKSNTEFHLPLLEHATAYEEWKLEKNIPNGIPEKMYYLEYGKSQASDFHKLKDIIKIDKMLEVPKDCDYTDPNTPRKYRMEINVY